MSTTISEIITSAVNVISEASCLPVYPLYSKNAESECCIFTLSPSSGQAGDGTISGYELRVRVSCRRYADALDVIERVSGALLTVGDCLPAWDKSGRVTAVVPSNLSEQPKHEFDVEFYQAERRFGVYVK